MNRSESKNSWLRWLTVIGSAVAISLAPIPSGISRESWILFAIFIATIIGSIVQPLKGSAMVLLGVVATILFGALPIEKALSGYADPVVWLVLAAFFISRAMIKTGLGKRIALLLVRTIGKKTLGLGYSLVFTDFLLASVIPSNAARNGGVILPIALGVSETYESKPDDGTAGKLGTFLMNLLYQSDVIICATFLTGQASNVIIAKLAKENSGIELTYGGWFLAAIVPSFVSLVFVPQMIYRFFPPEIKETPNAAKFASRELEKLGRTSLPEKILLMIFFAVVFLWATKDYLHHLDTTTVAFLGVAVLLITRVLEWKDLVNESGAWDVFIWYGGLVMMAKTLSESGLPKLFAESTSGLTSGMSWTFALAFLALVYFYAHYAFASITAHVLAMYVPFLVVTVVVGAPASLTVLLLAYFSNLSAGLTHYGTTPAPIYFGTGYVKQKTWWTIGAIASFLNILIWSSVGLVWWKILGRW